MVSVPSVEEEDTKTPHRDYPARISGAVPQDLAASAGPPSLPNFGEYRIRALHIILYVIYIFRLAPGSSAAGGSSTNRRVSGAWSYEQRRGTERI